MSGGNPTLEQRVVTLETQVADLQSRVTKLEGGTGPVDPNAESKDGTTITPGSGTIIDAKSDKWTIETSVRALCINGYQDGFTPPVKQAYYTAHVLYFQKDTGSWYQATGAQPAWRSCADPTGGAVPPNPNPPSGGTGDQTGTIAKRATDVFDFFGANCFPNGQDGAGASKDAPAHINGIKAIWGTSGFTPLMRVYADGRGPQYQIDWCKQIFAALPGVRFTACCTDASSADAVVTMINASKASGGWMMCVEGYNEPNNTEHLGGTVTTPQQCLDAQKKIYRAAHDAGIPCMSPSCADLTGDPQFIEKYYGSPGVLQDIIANSDFANIHNYLNSGGPNHELKARTHGISQTYGGKPPATSEFHPLLFNNTADENLGALYSAISKLSGVFDWGQQILTWYCMWDYVGFNKPVGLFRDFNAANMRPSAVVMQALLKVCADAGSTAKTFTPGKLDVSVSALPTAAGYSDKSGGRFGVMQRSDGAFLVAIWNEQDKAGSQSANVTVKFNAGKKSSVRRHSIGNPITTSPAVQNWTNVDQVSFALKQLDLQVLEVKQ